MNHIIPFGKKIGEAQRRKETTAADSSAETGRGVIFCADSKHVAPEPTYDSSESIGLSSVSSYLGNLLCHYERRLKLEH